MQHQHRSHVFSAIWRAQRGENCAFATPARAARRNFFATVDWITRFLWYLEMLRPHWVSADVKNSKVQQCFCREHNDRATESLQKVFFGIFFFSKARTPRLLFSLSKTAHFLIKLCLFSARGKFLAPGLRGEIFGGGPSAII